VERKVKRREIEEDHATLLLRKERRKERKRKG
jgi:hypothetical protein